MNKKEQVSHTQVPMGRTEKANEDIGLMVVSPRLLNTSVEFFQLKSTISDLLMNTQFAILLYYCVAEKIW